jgi:3-oxoacid CoA-transferase subunit A/glutaconate CoA-transferase subunit A
VIVFYTINRSDTYLFIRVASQYALTEVTGDKSNLRVLQGGEGELLGWHDPDENRRWVQKNKSRELRDKQMSAREAVSRFVKDGDFIASGGFGHVRVSMALVYEIIRQRKHGLALAGKTAVHDADIIISSGCVNRVEAAYTFGHELRGLSPASRRTVEEGRCKVVAEISNAGYQWRFLAGMMGIPFIPSRVLLGTDTLKHSSSKVVKDPFSGKLVCLIPACYPDVAIIHVHRCDKYGNAQIDGILVEDFELSRAARRLIVTTEEIISNDRIRAEPWRTAIPFYVVDAVVEVPYGSHPCQMPILYYYDEEHIGEWLNLSRTPEGVDEYFDRYVHGVATFEDYLELIGGVKKLSYLKKVEQLRAPMKAPWRRRR